MKTVKDFSLSNDGVLSEKTLMFHSFHFLTIHSLNSLLVSQVMVPMKRIAVIYTQMEQNTAF